MLPTPCRRFGLRGSIWPYVTPSWRPITSFQPYGMGSQISPALNAIQKEREREVIKVQKLQFQEVRGQRWARQRPWLMQPLLKLAPLLARTQFVQWSWLRQQRPLRFGVTQVRLHPEL